VKHYLRDTGNYYRRDRYNPQPDHKCSVKQYIGTQLTLLVPDGTPIFKIVQGGTETGTSTATGTNEDGTPGNRVPIPFEQLAVDQKVAIHGNLVNGVFIARLITVYIRAGETATQNPIIYSFEDPSGAESPPHRCFMMFDKGYN
jgi:hypothetical protein